MPSGIGIKLGSLTLQLVHVGVEYGNEGNPVACALLLIEIIRNPPNAHWRGHAINIHVLGVSFIVGWMNRLLPPGPPAAGTT